MIPQEVQQAKLYLAPLLQAGWSIQFDYSSTVIYVGLSNGEVATDNPTRVIARRAESADGTPYGDIVLNAHFSDTIPSQHEASLSDWAANFIISAKRELQRVRDMG